ncbi:MAG: shikimate dehydrogenase [Gammaproteobacteria bacterium]|nr:MAG: shikimate dehydrogenase [Gammaproteobacteria bacterium]
MGSLFDFDAVRHRFAVMGNPVSHSLSPRIHQAFARQSNIQIEYTAIQVDPGGFTQAVGNFFSQGGKGLNITVPFKHEAVKVANCLTDRASQAGAVNTLIWKSDQHIIGDNTDGQGLVVDIQKNIGVSIDSKRILIIGAGGAVHGIFFPLVEQHPAHIHVANRTVSRAESLVQKFSGKLLDTTTSFSSLENIPCTDPFDIIINGTSSSLQHKSLALPAQIIKPDVSLCYDLMYASQPTDFLLWAAENHCGMARDGLGMLVEQAAESFYQWLGIRPKTGPILADLERTLHAANDQ